VAEGDVRAVVDAVWRMESGKVVARLLRLTGDVGLAEDFAQDALVAALEQWPREGVPESPGAWLTTAAKRRAIDHLRKRERRDAKAPEVARELGAGGGAGLPGPEADLDASLDDPVGDDLLRLIFICCHPVLPAEARVALTLRLVGGLTTDEIARAFLVPKATLAQRIVRAKRTLREARVPFETPRDEALAERLASVLEVVYLIFNEGYSATAGDAWTRPELCREALRLGRILQGLAPDEPEVHGLVALMEIQASRLAARRGPGGRAVLLEDQDRSRWDPLHIRRGLEALDRAQARAQALSGVLGPYTLQAAIAACHARARTFDETDWPRIAALYDALAGSSPSPVVELNRAVAVGMAYGPEAGLELVDELVASGALNGYHLLPAVRGDLLAKLGRGKEARAEFERAAELTRNEREREVLVRRAEASGGGPRS
jgi:RNA polymerase sigma-70 factor, ECF subfamily